MGARHSGLARSVAVAAGTLCVVGIALAEWEIFSGTVLEQAFRDGFIAEGCLLGLITIGVSWWASAHRGGRSSP